MKIKEMLSDEVVNKLSSKKLELKKDEQYFKKAKRRRKKQKVKKDPLKQKMSTGFIKSLMGTNRPTYYKSGGAWHQK